MAACCQQCESIGGVDGGECDQAYAITWPSDVDRLKQRLAPIVEALDLGVKACPQFPEADRTTWNLFLEQWRPFAKRETPTFGSYNEWITACSYAHTIDGWREKIAAKCPSVPGPGPIPGANKSGAEALATVVKWSAIAIVAVAVVGGGLYVTHKVL